MLNILKKFIKNKRFLGGVFLKSIVGSVFIVGISLLICKSLDIHYLREVDSQAMLQEQYEKDMAGDYEDDYMLDDPLMEEPGMDYYNPIDYLEYGYGEETRSIKSDNVATYADGSIVLTNDFMDQLWGKYDSDGVYSSGVYTRASIKKLSFLYSATSGFVKDCDLQGAGIYYNPTNPSEVEVVYSGEMYAPVDCSHFFSTYNYENEVLADGLECWKESENLGLYFNHTILLNNELEEIFLNNFNTSETVSFYNMFLFAYNLHKIDVSTLNTESCICFVGMFNTCSNYLTEIDVSNFKTDKGITLFAMFANCPFLQSLNISSFNTANVQDFGHLFEGCARLTTITGISTINTKKATRFSEMFNICRCLGDFEFGNNWDSTNVTSFEYMFAQCQSMTKLDFEGWNTNSLTNIKGMFFCCNKLTSLNVSSFNTSQVTDMSQFVYGCQALTSLDISNFNTISNQNMYNMFAECINLSTLIYKSELFLTSSVTNMQGVFCNCYVLSDIDVSKFDTSQVTNMNWTFSNCFKFTSECTKYIEKFDTSSVLEMQGMLIGLKIKSLDLSGFDTSTVTNMSYLFYYCDNLESVNLNGKFTTKSATDIGAMFNSCFALQSVDLANFNTTKVHSMGHLFYNCYKLSSLDLSGFDTTNVINMHHMFNGCIGLESLDLSSFSIKSESKMFSGMFYNCINLKYINLGSLDLSKMPEKYSEDDENFQYNNNLLTNCTSLHTIIAPSALPTDFLIDLPSNFCIEGDYNNKVTTFTQPGKTYYRCYEINYNTDEGSTLASNAPTYYVYSQGIQTLPTCQKENYTFKNWYTESSYDNAITTISTTQIGDIYLYSKFLYDLTSNISKTNQSSYEYSSSNIYYKIIDSISNTELNNILKNSITIEYYINGQYVTEIPNNLQVGKYTIRINKPQEDNVYDSITNLIIQEGLVITQKDISTCDIYDIEDQVYKGIYIKPTVYILNPNNKEELSLYSSSSSLGDYTLAYEDNFYKGQATAYITGVNNYKGEYTITFNIIGKTLEQDKYYNLPFYLETTSGNLLTSLEDELNGNNSSSYQAVWEFINYEEIDDGNGLKIGSYIVEVECKPKDSIKNMYDSTYSQILIIVKAQTPQIDKLSIKENIEVLEKTYDTLSLQYLYVNYIQSDIEEQIKLDLSNLDSSLYEVSFKLNGNPQDINTISNAGIYQVKITIKGNEYYDDITTESYITINKRNITSSMIANIEDQAYTGAQIIPNLDISYTLEDNTKVSLTSNDYITFGGSNVIDSGIVYIMGKGNYTTEQESLGYLTKTFAIEGQGNDVYYKNGETQEKVSIIYTYDNELVYNGKSQIPTFKLINSTDTNNLITLIENTDYEIVLESGADTVNVGSNEIVVTINFKGSYSGSEFKTYRILAYTLSEDNVDDNGNVIVNNNTLVENKDYTKSLVSTSTISLEVTTTYKYTGINNYTGDFTVLISEAVEEISYFKFKDSSSYKFSNLKTGSKLVLEEVEHTTGNKGETNLYLDGITLNTKISDILNALENSSAETRTIKVYSSKDSEISKAFYTFTTITTNTRYDLIDSKGEVLDSFRIIIRGDVNGDGKINSSDVSGIKEVIKGGSVSEIYYIASDTNIDGKLTIKDYNTLS